MLNHYRVSRLPGPIGALYMCMHILKPVCEKLGVSRTMDDDQFDNLIRLAASRDGRSSRRKVLGVAILGTLIAGFRPETTASAQRRHCVDREDRCLADLQCCTRSCCPQIGARKWEAKVCKLRHATCCPVTFGGGSCPNRGICCRATRQELKKRKGGGCCAPDHPICCLPSDAIPDDYCCPRDTKCCRAGCCPKSWYHAASSSLRAVSQTSRA